MVFPQHRDYSNPKDTSWDVSVEAWLTVVKYMGLDHLSGITSKSSCMS